MDPSVFLALGSNLGDRQAAVDEALRRLASRGFVTKLRSSDWLTEPLGGPPQGWFVNVVVGGEWPHGPSQLLEACLDIEREMGRVRVIRDGPRTIDIDILVFGTLRIEQNGLEVPHPRLHRRRFVLAPFAEIAPWLVHPALGKTIAELLAACPDESAARPAAPRRAGS